MKKQKYNIADIKESNEFLFFWGHQSPKNGVLSKACLSQWWQSPFIENGIIYQTAEHFMMGKKALLFNDQEIF